MQLNLRKLFIDVFAPNQTDSVLFIMDVPGLTPDDNQWRERREMGQRWYAAMRELSKEIGFTVMPIAFYKDVTQHNNSLPEVFQVEADWVKVKVLIESASLIVSIAKWSATAPLHGWVDSCKHIRAASLPGVTPSMENTALAADYAKVADYCQILQPKLDAAEFAFIRFSTGDELRMDLRWRRAQSDDGRLHPDHSGKVINLPSGEVFSTLYEGERKTDDSMTDGVLPIIWKDSIVRLLVDRNTVVDVLTEGEAGDSLRNYLDEDPARKNVAEIGLGCNPSAVVSGNILEDEKAGPHIALGRSDHLEERLDRRSSNYSRGIRTSRIQSTALFQWTL